MKYGFDNDKYISIQSQHIQERIAKFSGKLYLELGGKLFDDYHACRVLPGFQPDSKLRMFQQLSPSAEILIVISALDIEKNKVRQELTTTVRTARPSIAADWSISASALTTTTTSRAIPTTYS